MPAMRAAISRMKPPSMAPINGRNTSSDTKMAMILGA